ncbi:mycobacterial membrane protein [Mycolicibacterium rhodesiae NBB3]|uniref:Mycobacterial membrane protein n=1 Tax=Mycolicibacterium rhodesiae (strain NBB3) TaxID=710685 RepID=G8RPS2_MYCRN|nr:MmpS family transport accessory protein [Mycolicibacterium rhodesiae]AEV72635.1 mycobacterial membrane protein [Mycolicibacterium rhodesiae NBB3]
MYRILTKAWMPLLLVVVVALGAYAVLRVRGDIGGHELGGGAAAGGGFTDPFNPKHITYEISSSAPTGGVSVDYLDENGQPHHVDAQLPWSYTIVTTLPSMSANIVAQADAGVSDLRCRVVVDGRVRDDRSTDEYKPFIYCLVKSV